MSGSILKDGYNHFRKELENSNNKIAAVRKILDEFDLFASYTSIDYSMALQRISEAIE